MSDELRMPEESVRILLCTFWLDQLTINPKPIWGRDQFPSLGTWLMLFELKGTGFQVGYLV